MVEAAQWGDGVGVVAPTVDGDEGTQCDDKAPGELEAAVELAVWYDGVGLAGVAPALRAPFHGPECSNAIVCADMCG